MSGIAGIIKKHPGFDAAALVDRMNSCMVHESFYRSGTGVHAELGVAVGWTCLENSFADCLPVWNETRDVCLYFSGEDRATQHDIDQLKARGHVFQEGNAGYLVHAYEEFDAGFLERLNGWFSGVLVDLRQGRVILFNDRYGLNRLYFHESADGFFFASEAKALLRVLPQLRKLDHTGLGELFACGCVLQNRTLFQNVSLVPGGSAWTFLQGHSLRRDSYFKKESLEQLPPLGADDYYEKLRAIWGRIVPSCFRGPERIGLSLTGGLDSRMILAWASQPARSLPCYTFSGPYRDCADATISRKVAQVCDQPHETIRLDADYFREFPRLAERAIFLTDGTLDATGSADLFVQRRCRETGPVRVTGLNGGELLRRVTMFKPWTPTPDLLASEFRRQVDAGAQTYLHEKSGHLLSFIMFKQAPWHLYARLALERSQIVIRTPYFDNELVALAYQAPPELINAEPALRLIAEGTPALKTLGTDRARLLRSMPGLTQVQRMVQEFTFKAEYAYDYGMPQWLARTDHVLSALHFERLFLGRHKFYHFRLWFRDQFAQFVREVLLDPGAKGRPYLNGRFLEKMVQDHTSGRANYTLEIQRVIAVELLQRLLLEDTAARTC